MLLCVGVPWQFKEMGFLSESMVNYLALLGWNDGTEEEIFTRDQLGKRVGAAGHVLPQAHGKVI